MGTKSTVSRMKLLFAFGAIYILWGSTYLAIRLAIDSIPPFLMAGSRFLIAGPILYSFSSMQAASRPTFRQWRNAAGAAILLFVLGNGGVTWAEQTVPTGAAALVIATLPAWLLLMDWGWRKRSGPRLMEVAGIALGLGGVAVLTSPGGLNPLGGIALVVSAVAWAAGSLVNRYADLPASPVRMAGMQMMAGGVMMISIGVLIGEAGQFEPGAMSGLAVAAFVYLVAVALVALPAYNWLLAVTSPALVGTYAFVNPVVAVLLGWAVVGEEVTGRTGVAAVLVVVGVAVLVWPRKAVANQPIEPRVVIPNRDGRADAEEP
jgi:drug/metabolite transporter (DMT)-like permease